MSSFWIIAILALLVILALSVWRHIDERALVSQWQTLIAHADADPPRIDPDALSELPEPARRFLAAAIRPGTPLRTVAEITMHGELSLGTKETPGYRPMRACQLLAAPYGFIWQVRIGEGMSRVVGSDAAFPGGSWTRFWLAGLVPVARQGGDADHALSSFGRYMAEAIFWTPAALMPSETVCWESLDEKVVRVTVTHGVWIESFDLTVNDAGRPTRVEFQRWSNANPEKTHRRQPFGGFLSEFREFDGFVLPTRIEAGNQFGTDDYFPFYIATIDDVHFLRTPDSPRVCRSPW